MNTRATATALLLSICAAGPSAAQEFGVYLNCKGQVQADGKTLASHVDLALRRNSQLALVQSSDILLAGQKMRLEITPQFYTMVFSVPARNSVVYHDWLRGTLLVWNPQLTSVHSIRMSVDRQSAALQGALRDGTGAEVGRLKMQCQHKDNQTVAEPKF